MSVLQTVGDEFAKAREIIDRVEKIINLWDRMGVADGSAAGAKLQDIDNLIERYRRGEA